MSDSSIGVPVEQSVELTGNLHTDIESLENGLLTYPDSAVLLDVMRNNVIEGLMELESDHPHYQGAVNALNEVNELIEHFMKDIAKMAVEADVSVPANFDELVKGFITVEEEGSMEINMDTLTEEDLDDIPIKFH